MGQDSNGFEFGTTRRNQAQAKGKGLAVSIGDMKHRVTLCSADDIAENDGRIVIARRSVVTVWAKIEEDRGSFWSRQGFAVKEQRETPSHSIFIRYRAQFDITAHAWIFEDRKNAPARWWKVLEVQEIEDLGVYKRFWKLRCRLVERSDTASAPQGPAEPKSPAAAAPLPNGVTL